MGQLKHHLSCGGGGCSHCGAGPQLTSPQLTLLLTGESSNNEWSSVALSLAISRSHLSILRQACSSLRNLMIIALSLWLVLEVFSGRDAAAVYWMCDW